MKLTNEEKKNIGILLKFLRLSHNLSQIDVYDGCCSSVTFSKIENGKIIKNDEVYDDLLMKFREKWNYDSLNILPLLHQFYCACELYDEKSILNIFSILKTTLNLNYIYEKEVFNAIKLVVDYYINDKIIEKEACLKYEAIFSIFPLDLQILVADVCFGYLSCNCTIDYVYDYMQFFDVISYNSIITRINAIKFYIWDERPLKAYQLLLMERDNLEGTKINPNRLTQIYMLNIIFMNNHQQKDLDMSMSMFEEYLIKNNASERFKMKGRLQLANLYYKNEMYAKAYDLYRLYVDYKPDLYTLILLNYMSTLLENNSLLYTPNTLNSHDRNDLMVIYAYYILKNEVLNKAKGDINDLVDFAYANFHNLVVDKFYEEIIIRELNWLSTVTKNYNIRRITVNKDKKK